MCWLRFAKADAIGTTAVFQLTLDACSGTYGTSPFGTVTLVQTATGVVTVTETLKATTPAEGFVATGAGESLAWNLTGNPVITIGNLTSGFGIARPTSASSFGNFASPPCSHGGQSFPPLYDRVLLTPEIEGETLGPPPAISRATKAEGSIGIPGEFGLVFARNSHSVIAKSLDSAHCGVRGRGQTHQICEEHLRLAHEESHGCQKLDRSRGYPCRVRRTNYRTWRQAGVDEWAGFRHDQVGLEHLSDCIAR